ncbi:MAG: pilus assembly protein TadG-related protein [Paracoccaceae bacterium]
MTLGSRLRRFGRDDEGAILVFWAVALAVMLGIVALSFDVGRMAATQSELQSYADHVALAAAAELDGKSDAITRANAAAANLIADWQTYGAGGNALAGVGSYTLEFFDRLPAQDSAAMSAGLTTNAAKAAYARVTIAPRAVDFSFGDAFFALSGNAPTANTVGATAVAGYTQYACDIAPMMFCIPNSSFNADAPGTKGRMIRLRAGGQGAAWGPGDFGFLQPSSLSIDAQGNCAGANGTGPQLRCALGAVSRITQCVPIRGVDIEPGQKVGITNAALNTRFDMWSGAMQNSRTDPIYAPAPNVIKGIRPRNGNCNWNNTQPTTDTAAMPRDTCMISGSCAPYGDGNWSAGRTTYVSRNYGGADPHPAAPTRYDYYLAEIAAHGGGASSAAILTGRSETGRPMCTANQSPDPERRILIVAGIDCAANSIRGSASGVPVHQFVKMFITEPVVDNGSGPNSLDIYAEIVGSADTNGGAGTTAGIVRDVVQLYR